MVDEVKCTSASQHNFMAVFATAEFLASLIISKRIYSTWDQNTVSGHKLIMGASAIIYPLVTGYITYWALTEPVCADVNLHNFESGWDN